LLKRGWAATRTKMAMGGCFGMSMTSAMTLDERHNLAWISPELMTWPTTLLEPSARERSAVIASLWARVFLNMK
jgi:hypothetical protein